MAHVLAGDRSPTPPTPLRPAGEPVREPAAALPLPLPLIPFVGRAREVAAVRALLLAPDVRLVTLTGAGGVGKTRLALAVAHDLAGAFADGAASVSLAAVDDPVLVAPAVANALGLREVADRRALDGLVTYLRPRATLLVLDNFEQVADAAPLVADLLAACDRLTVLVTSRAVLRLSGERAVPVPPLALPAPRNSTVADLAGIDAVALFAQRARTANPTFSLDAANAAVVAEICRRLEGLPLAIELAAARVRHLPPAVLLARLERRLPLLTGGARDAPARQRTMRDAIAWSHDLLDDVERALFRRLTVFRGGFTLAAAAAVCGAADELELLEGIESLVDKSLLRPEAAAGDEPRYGMLETVREFGLERLEESGWGDAVRTAHAAWCLAFAEGARPRIYEPAHLVWLNRVEAEYDNLRAALAWFLGGGPGTDAAMGLRLAVAVWPFWFALGHLAEQRAWLERGLALPNASVPTAVRVEALNGLGYFMRTQRDYDAARATHERALALAQASGDRAGVAHALHGLGAVAEEQGDDERAEPLLAIATAEFRDLGDDAGTVFTLVLLGLVRRRRGRLDEATTLLDEALTLARRAGVAWGELIALYYAGEVARDAGDLVAAADRFRESLAMCVGLGNRQASSYLLYGLADLAAVEGRPATAARLFGAAEGLREAMAMPLPEARSGEYERAVAAVRAALGDSAFAASWAAGRALRLEEAVAEAAALGGPPAAPAPAADRYGLSPREREVLRLLAEGRSDRAIAAALFISPKTAGNHVAAILAKLGVEGRTAAAALAVRHGLA